MPDRLTVTEAASLAGVRPVTWRVYVHRKQAPEPDGYLDQRTPYWERETVEAWLRERRAK